MFFIKGRCSFLGVIRIAIVICLSSLPFRTDGRSQGWTCVSLSANKPFTVVRCTPARNFSYDQFESVSFDRVDEERSADFAPSIEEDKSGRMFGKNCSHIVRFDQGPSALGVWRCTGKHRNQHRVTLCEVELRERCSPTPVSPTEKSQATSLLQRTSVNSDKFFPASEQNHPPDEIGQTDMVQTKKRNKTPLYAAIIGVSLAGIIFITTAVTVIVRKRQGQGSVFVIQVTQLKKTDNLKLHDHGTLTTTEITMKTSSTWKHKLKDKNANLDV